MTPLFAMLVVAVGVQAVSYLTPMERYQKTFDEEWLPECIALTNAPADIVKSNPYADMNSSQEIKCCVECLYEKEGLVADGAVLRGKTSALARRLQIPQMDVVVDAADKCDQEVPDSTEKCTTGVRLSVCFRKYYRLFGGVEMTTSTSA